MLKSGGFSDDERAKTCGRSTSFRRRTVSRQGEEKPARRTGGPSRQFSGGAPAADSLEALAACSLEALAAVAANHNTPGFRNRPNPLTNLEHSVF